MDQRKQSNSWKTNETNEPGTDTDGCMGFRQSIYVYISPRRILAVVACPWASPFSSGGDGGEGGGSYTPVVTRETERLGRGSQFESNSTFREGPEEHTSVVLSVGACLRYAIRVTSHDLRLATYERRYRTELMVIPCSMLLVTDIEIPSVRIEETDVSPLEVSARQSRHDMMGQRAWGVGYVAI